MGIKKFSILLVFVSFGLLIPGLTEPIFELSIDTEVNSKIANISANILHQKRSIINTITHLFLNGRYLVSFLILFFSVVVPVAKGLLLLVALFKKQMSSRKKILGIVSGLSKWSMADVFVVAIFLAFLATSQSGSSYNTSVSVMGMNLPLKLNSIMQSRLGSGFYYFLSYCMVSITSGVLVSKVFQDEK